MKFFFSALIVLAASQISFAKNVARKPASNPVKSFDGFSLTTDIELPAGMTKEQVKSVVVFVHGSGPNDLNEDLSEVTVPPGTKNLFFKDVSEALLKKGIATVRYNKRAFEVRLRLKSDPQYQNSKEFRAYMEHPFRYLVDDLSFFLDLARREFPNAKVSVLGHSEGTQVALHAASRKKYVSGVALIGFTNEPMTTSIFEQMVYRSLGSFKIADADGDGFVDAKELGGDSDIAKSLKVQLAVLDLDGDGKISISEYKAGNYSNLVDKPLPLRAYRVDQAALAMPSEVIRDSKQKILFLQGEWDNQTPQYFAQAIQIANATAWKKTNLRFVYFPKAGHALDPRESPEDLFFKKVPGETLDRIASEIESFLN